MTLIRHLTRCVAIALVSALLWRAAPATAAPWRVLRFVDASTIELITDQGPLTLRRGERAGSWTLVEIAGEAERYAVLENFAERDGRLLLVDQAGVRLDLGKTSESTQADVSGLLLGHTAQQVMDSATDLLGREILARPGDPQYADVERVFPPIRVVKADAHNFVGSPDTSEKIGFNYGGRTPNFDPAVVQPTIDAIRKAGRVRHGLVGGDLPVLRFVYPESDDTWTEMLAFAPLRTVNGNTRMQPVWYRVARIERARLVWSRVFDSYHPFTPDAASSPAGFYADLIALKQGWDAWLAPAMKIELPDRRMQHMARFGLVRAIMTRAGDDQPKYGAYEKDYGGSEHDGFQDTFNVETGAMLEWGLIERAGRYIDNYFARYVRDDGSILYRGPQTGQYGRMLTVVAQYAAAGGDAAVLLRHRARIDAVADLLLRLRRRAQQLPRDDAAYGMLAGWSEADSCLEANPARYVQPYFSNSTEAVRGWRDLGRVWFMLGTRTADAALTERGRQLVRESEALQQDLQRAIARSWLNVGDRPVLPSIAGVKEPFHVAVVRDPVDPQYRGYRAYMEMMHSGVLTAEQVAAIADYRSDHHDVMLGMPLAYGHAKGEFAGFLSYGHGWGLIQIDRIREALLLLYTSMAHQYTRGAWLAPETRRPLLESETAPYCSPAQLVATLLTRWLLVFEDPMAPTLWLGKGIPNAWLADGERTRVDDAPTRWGRVGFEIVSRLAHQRIDARVVLPEGGIAAQTRLRLRAGPNWRLRSVTLNGKPWRQFDAALEVVTLPAGLSGSLAIQAAYDKSK